MKFMNKLFAVLVLVSISNAAFGYWVHFANHSNQNANITVTLGGAGGQLNLALGPNAGEWGEYIFGNFPIRSIYINGIDMGYKAPALVAPRNVRFSITEDMAGNLMLNER